MIGRGNDVVFVSLRSSEQQMVECMSVNVGDRVAGLECLIARLTDIANIQGFASSKLDTSIVSSTMCSRGFLPVREVEEGLYSRGS